MKTKNKLPRNHSLKTIAVSFAMLGSFASLVSATTITGSGSTATSITNPSGDNWNVTTGTTSGKNAFNSFNKFDVSQGGKVDMHLPTGTDNLINVVKGSVNVDGIVNLLRNGKIGGNQYFVASGSIVIGASGVLNAGSVTLINGMKADVDDFFKTDALRDQNAVKVMDGTFPISDSGLITVKGQINAYNSVRIEGKSIELDGAKIYAGKTTLGDVVNLGNFEQADGISVDPDGTITLSAKHSVKADTTDIAKIKEGAKETALGLLKGELPDFDISDAVKTVTEAVLVKADAEASVVIKNSVLKADSDIGISAESTAIADATGNTVSFKGFELGVQVGMTNSDATVTIADGTIIAAGGKVDIQSTANAENSVKVDVSGEDAKFGTAVGIAYTDSKAKVNIGDGVSIVSKGDLTVDATVKDSITVEVKTQVGADAFGALAVGLSLTANDSGADATVNGLLNSKTGKLSLSANNIVDSEKNSLTVSSTAGKVEEDKDENEGDSKLAKAKDSVIGQFQKLFDKKGGNPEEAGEQNMGDSQSQNNAFALSGGVGYVNQHRGATVTVSGQNAQLIADGGEISISAIVRNPFTLLVDSSVEAEDGKEAKVAIGGALAMGFYEQSALVTVSDGAQIKARGNVSIASESEGPALLTDWGDWDNLDFSIEGGKQLVENLKTINENLNGTTGAKGSSKGGKLALAGSVSWISLDQTAAVNVLGGASIISDSGKVDFNAKTSTELHNYTGAFNLKELKGIKDQASGDFAAGGSFLRTDLKSKSSISIDNATVKAAGDVNLNAESTQRIVSFGGTGSKADTFGMAGTFTWLTIDDTTHALIGSGAIVNAGGDINLNAKDNLLAIALAGGVVQTESVGLGLSAAWNQINRDTKALAGGNLTAKGLNLNALNDGTLITASIAGTKLSDGKDESSGSSTSSGANANGSNATTAASNVENPAAGQEGGSEAGGASTGGKFGFGLSGAVSVNQVNDNAVAEISGGTLNLGTNGVKVTADNSSDIYSLTGAGVLNTSSASTSAAIAGAFSWNEINGETAARIKDSVFNTNGGSITLDGKRSGDIYSLAAGAAIGTGGGDTSASIAGSVTINQTNNETIAEILDSSSVKSTGSIILSATDSSDIYTLAGAVGVSASSKGVGVGAAVAINQIGNETRAKLGNSVLDTNSGVSLSATSDGDIISLVGAVGVSGTVGLAGTFAYNLIENETVALFDGINTANGRALGSITLFADNSADIKAINASVGGSSKVGIGAAGMYNVTSNKTVASIIGSNLNISGNVDVTAQSDAQIIAIAAGVGVGGKGGVGIALAFNKISNELSASIQDSTLKTTSGNINILANADDSEIYAAAFGAAGAGTVAGGASFAYNTINNRVLAYAEDSQLEAVSGSLSITAQSENSSIYGTAIGAAGAGEVAAGISALYNSISNELSAYVEGGLLTTNNGSITVSAKDTGSSIYSAAFGAAGAGTVAAGVGGAYNTVGNVINASISGDAEVNTNGTLSVLADSNVEIITTSATGAGAGTAAVSASVSLNTINNVLNASIGERYHVVNGNISTVANTGADITNAGTINVTVNDASSISSLSGTASGAGTVGAGAAFAYNTIGNRSIASVKDSSINASQLNVHATGNESIVSASIAVSGSGAVAMVGSLTVNTIGNTVSALIEDSMIDLSGNVSVKAEDQSAIYSMAGGVAGAGTVSAYAAGAYNRIANNIYATVSGSTILGNDVTVKAIGNERILTMAIGGGGSGVASVGASVAVNEINTDVAALLTDGATIGSGARRAGTVSVLAEDQTGIYALAGGINGSGGITASGNLVYNYIGENYWDDTLESAGFTEPGTARNNLVRAELSNATVTATTLKVDSSLKALQNPLDFSTLPDPLKGELSGIDMTAVNDAVPDILKANIMSLVFAGGGSAAGSFDVVTTVNIMNTEALAKVHGGSIIDLTGNATIGASDKSAVYSAALAANGSGGVSAVAAIAYNQIDAKVKALIDGSGTQLTAKSTDLTASAEGRIYSLAAGGSGSAFASGAASATLNRLAGREIIAAIQNGASVKSISGGNISLLAVDKAEIKSLAGAAAFSTVAVGAAASYNEIGTKVISGISGATVESDGSVLVNANSNTSIDSMAVAAAGSVGASIAGSTTINTLTNETIARIYGSSNVLAKNNVGVQALSTGKIYTGTTNVTISGGGSLGGSAAVNYIKSKTQAYIDGSGTQVNALGNGSDTITYYNEDGTAKTAKGLLVLAKTDNTVTTMGGGIAASGFASVAAAANVTLLDTETSSWINGAKINTQSGANSAQSVILSARDTSTVNTYAVQLAASGGVSLAALSDNIFITKGVSSSIKGGANVSAKKTVDVLASGKDSVTAYSGVASGGVVSGGVSVVYLDSEANVNALIDNATVNSEGTINVTASSDTVLTSKQASGSAGLLSGGGAVGVSYIDNKTTAKINGSNAKVNATGDLTVYAKGNEKINNALISASFGAVSGSASVGINTIRSETGAYVTGGAKIGAYNVNVKSSDIATIDSDMLSVSGGLAAVGGSVAVNTIRTSVTADVSGSGTQVTAGNNVNVSATGEKNQTVDVISGSGGLIAGSGAAIISTLGGTGSISTGKLGSSLSSITGDLNSNDFLGGSSSLTVDIGSGNTASNDSNAVTDAKTTRKGASNFNGSVFSTGTNGTTANLNATVVAGGNVDVNAKTISKAILKAGSVGVGYYSAGAGYVSLNIANNTLASLGGSITAKNVNVKADSQNTASKVTVAGGSGGVGAFTNATALIDSKETTTAQIAGSSILTVPGTVTVEGIQNFSNTAESGTVGVGAIAAGVSGINISATNTLKAIVGSSAKIGSEGARSGTVTVNTNGTYAYKADSKALSGGIATANFNYSNVTSNNTLLTEIGNNAAIYATAINAKSTVTSNVYAYMKGVTFASIVIGASQSTASNTYTNQVLVGNNAHLDATGNITLDATSTGYSASDVTTSGGASLINTGSYNTSKADIYGTTKVNVGSNAKLIALGNVNISATGTKSTLSKIRAGSIVSGISIAGKMEAYSTVQDSVTISLGEGSSIDASNVTVAAKSSITEDVSAIHSVTASLLGVGGDLLSQANVTYSDVWVDMAKNASISARNKTDISASLLNLSLIAKAEISSGVSLANIALSPKAKIYSNDLEQRITMASGSSITSKDVYLLAKVDKGYFDARADMAGGFSLASGSLHTHAYVDGKTNTHIDLTGAIIRASDILNIQALIPDFGAYIFAKTKTTGLASWSLSSTAEGILYANPSVSIKGNSELYGYRVDIITQSAYEDSSGNAKLDLYSYVQDDTATGAFKKVGNAIKGFFKWMFGKQENITPTTESVGLGMSQTAKNNAANFDPSGNDSDYTNPLTSKGNAGDAKNYATLHRGGDIYLESGSSINLVSSPKVDIVIDANGNVIKWDGVDKSSITVGSDTITIADILNKNEGYINLTAWDGRVTGNGTINANIMIEEINITNHSDKHLSMNGIDNINRSRKTATVQLNSGRYNGNDAPSKNIKVNVGTDNPSVNIAANGNGNISFNKNIYNPYGTVSVTAQGGSLYWLDSTVAMSGKLINLSTARGSIGQSEKRFILALSEDNGTAGKLTANSRGDIYLKAGAYGLGLSYVDPASLTIDLSQIRTLGKLDIELGTVFYNAYVLFPNNGYPYWDYVFNKASSSSKVNAKLGNITAADTITIGSNNGKYESFNVYGTVTSGLADINLTVNADGSVEDSTFGYAYSLDKTTGVLSVGDIYHKGGTINLSANSLTKSGSGTLKVLDAYSNVTITNNYTGGTGAKTDLGKIDLSNRVDGKINYNGSTIYDAKNNNANGTYNNVVLTQYGYETADVTAKVKKGDLTVNNGILSGSVDGLGAGKIILTAEDGTVKSKEASSLVRGNLLTVTAKAGINLYTTVASAVAKTTGAGNIVLNETDAIVLTEVNANNGKIEVTAGSTITADQVVSNTDAEANTITLWAKNGDVLAGSINAKTKGDVTLTATNGSVKNKASGSLVTGDVLMAAAKNDIDLNTAITSTTSKTTGVGNIILNETDTIVLTEVSANNGKIEVTAGSTITADQVVSNTDAEANTITLWAKNGDVLAGSINAKTKGDVTLTATNGSVKNKTSGSLVTGDILTVTAKSDIDLNTTVTSVVAKTTGAGSIVLNETDAIVLTEVNANNGKIEVTAGSTITADQVVSNTDAEANTITLLAKNGDVLAGSIDAKTKGDVTLTATNGSVKNKTGSSLVTGDILMALSKTGIDLNTTVTSATARTTGAGNIVLNETDTIVLTEVNANNGKIDVTAGSTITADQVVSNTDAEANTITLWAKNGDVLAGSINAKTKGDVTLTATNGSVKNKASGSLVTGDILTVIAKSGIDLNTTVTSAVAKTTGAGNIVLNETDAIVLTEVNANNGKIEVTAGSTITADQVVSNTDAEANTITLLAKNGDVLAGSIDAKTKGDVILTATNGSVKNKTSGSLVTGDVLTATAKNDIDLNTAITSTTSKTTGVGNIILNETDAIVLTEVTTANGAITVNAGGNILAVLVQSLTDSAGNNIRLKNTSGNIEMTKVDAGYSGDIWLTSENGAVYTTASAVSPIRGNNVDIFAGAYIKLIDTEIARLIAIAQSGDITVEEKDDLNLSFVEARGTDAFINIVTHDGGIVILSGEGGLHSNGGYARMTAENGDIVIQDEITTQGGTVTLDASSGIHQQVTASSIGHINTADGDLHISARDGDFIQDDNATASTGSGIIDIYAENNVLLSNINTQNATADAIRITANTGAILDNGDTHADIISSSADGVVTLVAANGIGQGNALETMIANLYGKTTNQGDILIDNVGTITIHDLETSLGRIDVLNEGDMIAKQILATGDGNDVALMANDATLTVGSITASQGNVYLTSGDTLSTLNNAVLTGNIVSLTSEYGSIGTAGTAFSAEVNGRMEAVSGRDIYFVETNGDISAGNIVSKHGSIRILADAGNVEITFVSAPELIDIRANGSKIQLGEIGSDEGVTHVMYDRHATLLGDPWPYVRTDGITKEMNLEVNQKDGWLLIDKMHVRDAITVKVDNSKVEHAKVYTDNVLIDLRGWNGDRGRTAEWYIDAIETIDYTKYSIDRGQMMMKAENVHVRDGETISTDFFHTYTRLIVENELRSQVDNRDTQLFSPNERFSFSKIKDDVFSPNYYINYNSDRIEEALFGNENSLVRLGRKENAIQKNDVDNLVVPKARQDSETESGEDRDSPILNWDTLQDNPWNVPTLKEFSMENSDDSPSEDKSLSML